MFMTLILMKLKSLYCDYKASIDNNLIKLTHTKTQYKITVKRGFLILFVEL